MDLLDLLKASGGERSVDNMAKNVGIGAGDAGKLIAALAPALMKGLGQGSGDGLRRALQTGGHDRYIDNPDLMASDDTRSDGNKILGHILGSKDRSRQVAAEAERETGIDAGLIKKALPFLATLAMGAMAKKTNRGESGGGLGDLLGMAKAFLR